jgi:hypothetical protein
MVADLEESLSPKGCPAPRRVLYAILLQNSIVVKRATLSYNDAYVQMETALNL